tara:strand:+ start:805 stop:2391 length:1587 start_codon:yes stop_codon:yes gene_type:complete
MPIKFRGPVRPHKLKSPDPINMPVVRNDKVPRIKSDVLYYKENGSLPVDDNPDTHKGLVAGIGHNDWQAGDGLVTSDYYTGLDWLKMQATAGMTIPEVEAALASDYPGWRIANNYEVATFFNNIIIDTEPTFDPNNLFDPTPGSPSATKSLATNIDNALREYIGYVSSAAYGWWYEYASDQPSVTDGIGGGGVWQNGTVYDYRYSSSTARENTGVFLVRNGTAPTYADQMPLFPRGNYGPAKFYVDFKTGVEWLKLNYSMDEVLNDVLSKPEYAGLRIATETEVNELVEDLVGYLPTPNYNMPAVGNMGSAVYGRFSDALTNPGKPGAVFGEYIGDDDVAYMTGAANFSSSSIPLYYEYTRHHNNATYNVYKDQNNRGDSIYLVRDGNRKPAFTDEDFYVDPVSGLEWLKIPNSTGQSFETINTDYRFVGLRLATDAEIDPMIRRIIGRDLPPNTFTYSGSITNEEEQAWESAMGVNSNGFAGAMWLDDQGTRLLSGSRSTLQFHHRYDYGTGLASPDARLGIFLVKL